MTAPIASGWSDCRVGLSPTGKRRLCTAHANCGLAHRPLVPEAKVAVTSIVAYLSLGMSPINPPCCVRHK
jgi:hypothetical protein